VLYETAETAARKARVVLWADPNPIPPWDSAAWHQGAPRTHYCTQRMSVCDGRRALHRALGGKYCIAADGRKRYSH
jgi:hypothetical protein